MIDKREKALNGLKCCACPSGACGICPYFKDRSEPCVTIMATDVLEMLKEQEAVEPETEILNEIDRIYRCSKCHKAFFYRNQKYCDRCGQKVKWDD